MHPRLTELLASLDVERRHVLDVAAPLPAERWTERPGPDRWSVSEVCWHLAKVERGIAKLIAKRATEARSTGLPPDTGDHSLPGTIDQFRVTDRSIRIQAPAQITPTENLEADAVQQRLADSRALLRTVIADADGVALGNLTHPHPVFGDLDLHQWILFVGQHERRHAEQISETVSALTSPASPRASPQEKNNMMRRSLSVLSLVLAAAAPLAAQGGMAGMNHDMDKHVAGGPLPAGWMGRTDHPNQKVEDAKFVVMGKGFHVTSGPAAIYWMEKTKVSGPFTATATFRQTKNPMHPEAYGLFFMGNKLESAEQNYAYILVRGDGQLLVNHRAGADIHKIIPWTENAAVHKADDKGVATNTVSVDATKTDSLRLFVNGVRVAAIEGSHLGSTDGYVGLRVNHNLDVHISDFVVTPKQ